MSEIFVEEIIGNATEVTVIVKNSEGLLSDTIAKPHKVKISSDVQREIICPKIGRTVQRFFDEDIVDGRTLQYQLTTSVSNFMKIYLSIFSYEFSYEISYQKS